MSRILYTLNQIREKGEPDLADYQTLEAWAHALIDWKVEKRMRGVLARLRVLEAQSGIAHDHRTPEPKDN